MKLIIHFSILFAIGCSPRPGGHAGEGFLAVNGGKIWYKVIGNGDGTPILLLHGGPGSPSYYLNPLAELSEDRRVIMFDQLGCGRSDRISDTTLMSMDNYVNQVRELVLFLDLKEFYLYGHSWGTMLATDYYLKYPEGIVALIMASPCLSAELWMKDAETLISTLPDSVRTVLQKNISGEVQDSVALRAAVDFFLKNFYARRTPITQDLDSAHAQTGHNVYRFMWGDNEFFATGTLKDYDRVESLSNIKVPTLYTVGEFDETLPATVRHYQSLTPVSRLKIISGAGHMTMHDNPEEDVRAISEFLRAVDTE